MFRESSRGRYSKHFNDHRMGPFEKAVHWDSWNEIETVLGRPESRLDWHRYPSRPWRRDA